MTAGIFQSVSYRNQTVPNSSVPNANNDVLDSISSSLGGTFLDVSEISVHFGSHNIEMTRRSKSASRFLPRI